MRAAIGCSSCLANKNGVENPASVAILNEALRCPLFDHSAGSTPESVPPSRRAEGLHDKSELGAQKRVRRNKFEQIALWKRSGKTISVAKHNHNRSTFPR